jgi:hypothetical protein
MTRFGKADDVTLELVIKHCDRRSRVAVLCFRYVGLLLLLLF